MNADLIVDIRVPKVLLLNPGVPDPDTHELGLLLILVTLIVRTCWVFVDIPQPELIWCLSQF